MSKLFYDKLVALEKIEKEINKIASTKEEKEDLERIVDEYIHHRMLGCILEQLPIEHHDRFLSQLRESPHHEGLWEFLQERTTVDIEESLRLEVVKINGELLEVIKPKSSK